MGFFGFGKKNDVVDLGEMLKRREKSEEITNSHAESQKDTSIDAGGFSFFDSSPSTPEKEDTVELSASHPDKKKRLAKRLIEMTNKLEDISNQIYHLQQRMELLERKLNIN